MISFVCFSHRITLIALHSLWVSHISSAVLTFFLWIYFLWPLFIFCLPFSHNTHMRQIKHKEKKLQAFWDAVTVITIALTMLSPIWHSSKVFNFVVLRPIILSFNYSLLFIAFFEAQRHKLRMCVAWNFIWALEFVKRESDVLPHAKPHKATHTHAVCMYQFALLCFSFFCHRVDKVKLHAALKITAIFPNPFAAISNGLAICRCFLLSFPISLSLLRSL